MFAKMIPVKRIFVRVLWECGTDRNTTVDQIDDRCSPCFPEERGDHLAANKMPLKFQRNSTCSDPWTVS
jgi:hypothetical protein